MAANKTQPTDTPIEDFITAIPDPKRREEAVVLLPLMRRASGEKPVIWGDAIVGFGLYSYRYASGRSGQFFLTGFAPRKAEMTVHIMPGFSEAGPLLERLGPHRTGRSCLYIRRLDKIDLAVLEELVCASVEKMRTLYPD